MRRLMIAALAIVLVIVGYPIWIALHVWHQSRQDELHSADAIVVLGAAQYNGRPSPVFRARLDHAMYLYQEGFSRTVIVTGGKRPGDRFTEAEAGEGYLSDEGVPPDAIRGENTGRSTLDSLNAVRQIADDHEIDSLLLVSDPMHSERLKRIAGDLGFADVYASPASYVDLHRSRETKARELMREVASILAYQLLDK